MLAREAATGATKRSLVHIGCRTLATCFFCFAKLVHGCVQDAYMVNCLREGAETSPVSSWTSEWLSGQIEEVAPVPVPREQAMYKQHCAPT